jgi:ceramide glucosyltransferase
VILNYILGTLAGLSLLLVLWQWFAAWRFPLHRRTADAAKAPGVTLLKSLKGCDEHTEKCLRSWFAQDYAGEVQILFGVARADDPVCAVVEKLLREFPKCDGRLVVCSNLTGANAKVSKLAQLELLAKHEIIVVSDADVWVPPDFLVNIVEPLSPSDRERESDGAHGVTRPTSDVGLVNCFYRLANPTTTAMRWEAVAINADFWSQVLQSRTLKPLDFALGAVMATRRKFLAEIGGFKALENCLADDYQLGNRIAKRGHRIELCPVVVECWESPMGWREVWKHQLRWARTIRVCQPVPYFFSILSNATWWALVFLCASLLGERHQAWFSVGHSTVSVEFAPLFAMFVIVVRIVTAVDLQRRLEGSWRRAIFFEFVPLKDLLQVLVWLGAFAGSSVEWRGQKYHVQRDGTLVKSEK